MGELKSRILFVCALVLLVSAAPVALGDWDPGDGHKMHYPQLPKPGGWDVSFDPAVRLADDWQCSQTSPVTDIHFWVSWEIDMVGPINSFSVRIWSDNPSGTNGYSEPNELLWERDFDIDDFTVRDMPDDLQGWFNPFSGLYNPQDHIMWQQINIEDINDPWIQQEGKIYWLEIDMWGAEFCGWKESGSPHFLDDAVGWWSSQWNELIDPEIYESMDLAFVITTGPLKHQNLKWSQPPIEWDPCLPTPIYCGWDEESYLSPVSTLVYENWDVNGTGSYAPGQGVLIGDDITLAGTERKLDHYDFTLSAPGGTAPYTVTSELYTEGIDPCTGYPIPGAPIPGTYCAHNVLADGVVTLDCAPGSGTILPDTVWMVLEFDTDDAGWWIGEAAEVGYSGDYFALDDGIGWSAYWFGGDPQASFEADIWCESEQYEGLMVADDYRCLGSMPVTSIHWWGSHLWWEEPGSMPPDLPIAWRIGFWSNVPAEPTADPNYSYPEKLLWQIEVDANRVEVKEVGIDEYPEIPFYDICYQYYLDLEPNEIFWQGAFLEETMDDIFWLSIAAVYDPCVEGQQFPWGWKTRPWSWMDDAVRFWVDENPVPGMVLDPGLNMIEPIIDPVYGESFDLAFELDTDPNYIKWEQPFTGIRDWPHYEDELSMAIEITTVETITKYIQYPDLSPNGVDVDATVDLSPDAIWSPQILADDFNCTVTGLITDIHIWGSWYHNEMPYQDPMAVDFTLSIYSDNPVGPAGWSEPNELLWSQDFAAGDFDVWTFASGLEEGYYVPCEPYYEPFADDICYQYDFYIDPCNAFPQKGSPDEPVVYWLVVEAQPLFDPGLMEPARFGWKTSKEHWKDDAVWTDDFGDSWWELRYPADHPFAGESIDLAFEITTEEEETEFHIDRLVADDWPCDQNTPITAAVWWGSYIGYEYAACVGPQPIPPVRPDYFLLSIWTDVPAGVDLPWSHPNDIIWEYKAYDYDEVLVGYDKDPRYRAGPPREPVFRYSVRLPRDTWFFQDEPNDVYWFSVVAVYDENEPDYDWGWTNHKHVYNDDAVEGYWDDAAGGWFWNELYDQTGLNSVDMSFILFTDPDPTICTCWELFHCPGQPVGDATCDGNVNIMDVLKVKQSWGKSFGQVGFNACADFDHSCSVNIMDILKVKQNWGASGLGGDFTTTPPATCP